MSSGVYESFKMTDEERAQLTRKEEEMPIIQYRVVDGPFEIQGKQYRIVAAKGVNTPRLRAQVRAPSEVGGEFAWVRAGSRNNDLTAECVFHERLRQYIEGKAK